MTWIIPETCRHEPLIEQKLKYFTKTAAGPKVLWINPKRLKKVVPESAAFFTQDPKNSKEVANLVSGRKYVEAIHEAKKKGGLILMPKVKPLAKDYNPKLSRALFRHELSHWKQAKNPGIPQKMQTAGTTGASLYVPGSKTLRNVGNFIEEWRAYNAMKYPGMKFKSKRAAISYHTGAFQTVGAAGSTRGYAKRQNARLKEDRKKVWRHIKNTWAQRKTNTNLPTK